MKRGGFRDSDWLSPSAEYSEEVSVDKDAAVVANFKASSSPHQHHLCTYNLHAHNAPYIDRDPLGAPGLIFVAPMEPDSGSWRSNNK